MERPKQRLSAFRRRRALPRGGTVPLLRDARGNPLKRNFVHVEDRQTFPSRTSGSSATLAAGAIATICESKAQRLWPRPMPRIPAFRRSALSVRFIFLAISGRGVRAFECALSSRTSSLVHGVRWAEVFFFGTDCCSGKGSRLRATPVAWSTHASKRIPHLATPLRWPLTWPRTPACRFRGSVRGSAASINRNGEVSEHRASDHPVSANTGALDEREEGAPQGQCRFARTAPLVHLQGPRRHQCWRSRLHAVDRGGDRGARQG